MEKEAFIFTRLEKEDLEKHLELMRAVFGQNSRIDLMVKKWVEYHPEIKITDFFVSKNKGRIVAALNLIPSRWSIGGIHLKVAELGCVATLPEYRHRGLQSMLMNECHEHVKNQAFDLVAIEGIPYYYRQFGYEYALPLLEETRIDFEQIPDYARRHDIRSLESSDIPQVMQLLNQSKQKFYVHTIRDEKIWRMQQETHMIAEQEFEANAVEEEGKLVAYFRLFENHEDNQLIIREITDVNFETSQSVLAFAKEIGRKRRLRTLVAKISYHEPFAEYLASIGGIKHFPLYAWQLRILDYVRLFQKMRPLFEQRLANSMYRNFSGEMIFNFFINAVQLIVKNGMIDTIQCLDASDDKSMRMNPLAFVQLAVGCRDREELEAIYPDFLIRASHKHMVDVLFPKLPSYIHVEI